MLVVVIIEQRLGAADAGGLHALLALLGDEGDSLALLKGLEAVLLLRESVMSSGEMRSILICRVVLCAYVAARHASAYADEADLTSMARKWTKRSAEPFSGVMKP